MLKTPLPAGDHFYSRIGGRPFDFTESQFAKPIEYKDLSVNRTEAQHGVAEAELTALRDAFTRAWTEAGDDVKMRPIRYSLSDLCSQGGPVAGQATCFGT